MSGLEAHGGWSAVLADLVAGRELSDEVAAAAMSAILSDEATPAQIAGFAVALRAKGVTAGELSALLDATLDAATFVPLDDDERDAAVDVVGTGGDGSHSINVSTLASIVAAATGAPVCKHGNRSASSRCGTADVLEALGVAIEQTPEGVAACVREAGIGFCFAPRFHPAFRFAGPPRRELGIPTVFNLLGPMANPARVRRQLIGVADPAYARPMIEALQRQGLTSAWVVHGAGLDELSTTGTSQVLALRDGEISSSVVDPTELGFALAASDDLRGGDPDDNARAARAVLDGSTGPHRDIVVLNAGAALVVAGRTDEIGSGIEMAAAAIDDGSAARTLDSLVAVSQAQVAA